MQLMRKMLYRLLCAISGHHSLWSTLNLLNYLNRRTKETMIRKFTIGVDDSSIAALKNRLNNTRFFENVRDADWSEGVPVSEINTLIAYWRDGFDWRTQESRLNRLPQYVCTLDRKSILFIKKAGVTHPGRCS